MDSVRSMAGLTKRTNNTYRLLTRVVFAGQQWCPRQDSNLRSRLRRAVLYPLSYGGIRLVSGKQCYNTVSHSRARPGRAYRTDCPFLAGSGAQPGAGSGWAPRWAIKSAMYLLSAPCEMMIFSARLRT